MMEGTMQIITKPLDEIRPYEKNPRKNDAAVDGVAASIREFGFKVPIIIDAAGTIIAGHTRYKAAQKLGLESVPCIQADDLSPEQVRAYRLADNKVAEAAGWDEQLLADELADILDIDMSIFGFEIESEESDEKYTVKIDIPQYQITGEEPAIEELVDEHRVNELIDEIERSKVTKKQKQFLRLAAFRHYAFNYRNIAEYYAHQSQEMQELMEKSALVIIDFDDAIKNGYTTLSNTIAELRDADDER